MDAALFVCAKPGEPMLSVEEPDEVPEYVVVDAPPTRETAVQTDPPDEEPRDESYEGLLERVLGAYEARIMAPYLNSPACTAPWQTPTRAPIQPCVSATRATAQPVTCPTAREGTSSR